MTLNKIDQQYQCPKIIYIDINTDINHDKYKIFKKEEQMAGWTFHESRMWTRKGYKGQKDTNIDIVITKAVQKDNIEVNWGFLTDCSDHVPVHVRYYCRDMEKIFDSTLTTVKYKKQMKWKSRELLKELFLARTENAVE